MVSCFHLLPIWQGLMGSTEKLLYTFLWMWLRLYGSILSLLFKDIQIYSFNFHDRMLHKPIWLSTEMQNLKGWYRRNMFFLSKRIQSFSETSNIEQQSSCQRCYVSALASIKETTAVRILACMNVTNVMNETERTFLAGGKFGIHFSLL